MQQLVPIEVERKLEFLLTQVPHSSYTYYLKWFLDSIGMEFGNESESLLVDIIRYVIVNIHPPNEIIFESDVLKRYVMIGNLIQQQTHQVHQPWVLQAIFFDWLSYDASLPHSIMLVEPAMLLLYRSCENNPFLTDSLVEFLYNYASYYEESRRYDFMKSVQRVMQDCQRKGVVSDVRKMINHPKLKPDTQYQLKFLFRASEEIENIKERERSQRSFEDVYKGGPRANVPEYQNMIDDEFQNLPANAFNDDEPDEGKLGGDADYSAYQKPEERMKTDVESQNKISDEAMDFNSNTSQLSVGSVRPHSATNRDDQDIELERSTKKQKVGDGTAN